jgi:hypothetical protein
MVIEAPYNVGCEVMLEVNVHEEGSRMGLL